MKKLIVLFLMCFALTGCSLLPRVTFDTPNTLPQSTDKSSAKFKCSGKIEYYEDGTVKSCSKGFYQYQTNYQKQERKMTITERVKSYINALAGWGFWGVVLIIILCPSLLGIIVGRVLEATGGIAKTTLNKVAKAVQEARKNGKDLNVALESELDEKNKKYIADLKTKEKIK